MDFNFDILALLFIVAMVAGFIDAIAGGGGLITVPALLAVGIPPTLALGTNKLQGSGGSFAASLYFIRQKTVNLKEIKWLIILTFLGSSIGTILIQLMDAASLKMIIPFLIFIVGLYFLFSPNLGKKDAIQRISLTLFGVTAAMGIGFYDGFLGPGAGSFFTLAFVSLLGFNLPKSVAHAKVLNFTSNSAALLFFILGGAVLWKVGLFMMIGQFIGGNLGARMVVTKGQKLIRPMIVIMSFTMVIKMLYDQGYFY
ncbi:TSUP family transporter [Pasteurella skyensis]|uniref:Probable membrane transporter protein n=1 Tax=Phocoenobacter skyensis TaxID=97481 RepID=A0AAJ6NE40_9PAST|nr:TSUP family transporter [Pasteurella skyensis]MDP8170052.1 TSUP family transporter [Pasteurella skyensis]MDP8175077.1 TSUP family transporter [Pasteurella skyensis]